MTKVFAFSSRQTRVGLLLLFPFLGPIFTPCTAQPPPFPVIRGITIQGNTRTRTEIIRRELLFTTGDLLDPDLVAETERNLRRLLFLGQVAIHVRQRNDGVDILIQVEDLYSRALSPLLSGELDELSYGLVALDYNFSGRGQIVRLTLDHQAVSGSSATLDYQIPRIFDQTHDLATTLGIGREGHEVDFTLSRPFYTLADRRAYGISLFSQENVQRLYAVQALTARYADCLDGGSVWYTHSFGKSTKYRSHFRLSRTDRRFHPSSPYTYAPQDRRRVLPSAGFTIWQPRFEKARFIHALGRTEDLQMGSWVSLRFGLSRESLGSDRNFGLYQVQLSPRFKPCADGYSFATLFLSTRQGGHGFYHLFTLAEFTTYARVRQSHSLALRLRWDALHRPEDEAQLLLGVDRGLRGFSPRRFDGTRRFLFNLEARPTFYQHPFYVLAGALFVDGGTAWTPSCASPHLNLSLGLGGRIGLPRVYDTPILRADLTYGWQDAAWQLSFGIGQYF